VSARPAGRAGRPPQRAAGRTIVALLAGALLAGCASYTTRLQELRPAAGRGELDAALAEVERAMKPGDLLYHLERGALLHYAGRWAESNDELASAERRLEELYTISLSERGLTFLLNDEVEDYRGETYEGSYLHYVRLLNYLALDDANAAAVEARALALRLATLRDQPSGEPGERGDPFLQYLTGVVLENSREWNAALISYRLAREGWLDGAQACASAAPTWLMRDLLHSAGLAGIRPDEIGLGNEPEVAGEPAPGDGSVLVLFESGWAPHKVSEHLRVPIFAGDRREDGEAAALASGRVLAERVRYHRERGSWSDRDMKIDYMIDVAIPVLAQESPGASACRIRLDPLPTETDSSGVPRVTGAARGTGAARIGVDSRAAGEPVDDLACRAQAAFDAKEPAALAKTLARALIKYGAQQGAEKQSGWLMGWLVNLAGMATEKADTRAWLMLPAQIRAARVDVPAGRYRLRLEAVDGEERVLGRQEREIEVAAQRTTIVAWRSFTS
jgi:hypothetical protein